MSDCIFCRIASGKVPADVVYADERVVAFRDMHPVAPMHILIIPRIHIASISAAETEHAADLAALLLAAKSIASAQGLNDGGYRLVINTGESAGQTVFHIHVHLLAGRELAWPPG